MACILFVYSTTSIRAAKENARRYRERDTGGEGLSLLEESRRRHGLSGRREGERGVVGELAGQLFGGKEEEVVEGEGETEVEAMVVMVKEVTERKEAMVKKVVMVKSLKSLNLKMKKVFSRLSFNATIVKLTVDRILKPLK